jgi:RimJ/RimL family protein N-acetyltransferase
MSVGYRAALVFALPTATGPAPVMPPGLIFAFVEPERIDRMLLGETAWTMELIQKKASQGRRFFVGIQDGRQCYFSVMNCRDFVIGGRFHVRLDGNTQAYVGGCHTAASHRGQGVYPLALQCLGQRLAAEGERWLFLHIEVENESSMRGVRKAGFRPVARASVFRVLGLHRRNWRLLPVDEAWQTCGVKQWGLEPDWDESAEQ